MTRFLVVHQVFQIHQQRSQHLRNVVEVCPPPALYATLCQCWQKLVAQVLNTSPNSLPEWAVIQKSPNSFKIQKKAVAKNDDYAYFYTQHDYCGLVVVVQSKDIEGQIARLQPLWASFPNVSYDAYGQQLLFLYHFSVLGEWRDVSAEDVKKGYSGLSSSKQVDLLPFAAQEGWFLWESTPLIENLDMRSYVMIAPNTAEQKVVDFVLDATAVRFQLPAFLEWQVSIAKALYTKQRVQQNRGARTNLEANYPDLLNAGKYIVSEVLLESLQEVQDQLRLLRFETEALKQAMDIACRNLQALAPKSVPTVTTVPATDNLFTRAEHETQQIRANLEREAGYLAWLYDILQQDRGSFNETVQRDQRTLTLVQASLLAGFTVGTGLYTMSEGILTGQHHERFTVSAVATLAGWVFPVLVMRWKEGHGKWDYLSYVLFGGSTAFVVRHWPGPGYPMSEMFVTLLGAAAGIATLFVRILFRQRRLKRV